MSYKGMSPSLSVKNAGTKAAEDAIAILRMSKSAKILS